MRRPDAIRGSTMSDDRVRTTNTSVHFNHPFQLKGMDVAQCAGTYSVDQDAERIESDVQIGYRLVATYIYLTGNGGSRMVAVDVVELEAALARDAQLGAPEVTES